MMQIVYFSQKEQFLTELGNYTGEKIFITPSPAKADGLRERLLHHPGNHDVITIAKFTSHLVQFLWEGETKPSIKRKSELLLIFGILKNKYLPELGFEQFTQAYNLFSDLRSFTLNEEALSSVMDEQPEEIRQAVKLFWQLLELTGDLDEHGAYQKITEALRSSEEIEELKKNHIFWGFQHLNGQQVDLLKALSIRYEVIIPFPLALKEKLKRSDWPSWLKEARVKEVDLPLMERSPKASWLPVNSRELALNLRSQLRDHDQVILGVSKLSPLHLDMIPSQKVSYKIPNQLVQFELTELYTELKDQFREAGDLLALDKYLADCLAKKPSFKVIKAIELYQDAVKLISDMTDENIAVDPFFLKLLNEVVTLNQPRTSYVPMAPHDLTIDMKDMSSLEDVKRDRRVILCVDDRFEEIQSLGQNYTEAIQKALAALGPLKRNELELLFKRWEFQDLFSQAEVLVLMSESTLKHSLIWKRLFQDIPLEKLSDNKEPTEKKIKDHFKSLETKSFAGSFSASKFQSFLDCPRKFYFSYVDKVFPQVSLEKDFDSLVSGTISHRIIELFHKRKLNEDQLPALTKEVMQEFIDEKKLHLPRETYLQHQIVFNHRALNGIQFLKQFEEIMGEKIEWTIEQEFSLTEDYKLTGKIDCVGVSERSIILLDFKSTAAAASTNSEVEEMESLQLWTYAKAASKTIKDFTQKNIVLGYVSLDKPVESNLLVTDEDLASKVKTNKFCKQKYLERPFSEIFQEAQEKMASLVLTIQAEKDFPALPRKSTTCRFCELTKVCVKSEIKHE
ncbi:MAG: PD-(D/E)XK nuclease family protein [Bacteriovoracaceae bacterium]|nr:PD-(D/E)XK nuclease family protein [Bacteriovoracaceae bacterium]